MHLLLTEWGPAGDDFHARGSTPAFCPNRSASLLAFFKYKKKDPRVKGNVGS